jgi:hypothetical protein
MLTLTQYYVTINLLAEADPTKKEEIHGTYY